MLVVHSINSFVGKVGNIGLRTGYIIDSLRSQDIATVAIARGAVGSYKQFSYTMGIFGQIPRILNAYRIYVDNKFNMRKYDISLYEYFAKITLKRVISKFPNTKLKILHSWELSPNLLRLAKLEGFFIIHDVPIAPTVCPMLLDQQGLMKNEYFDFEAEIRHEKECFNYVDIFLAPSEFVKKMLIQYDIPDNKIVVIPFGCNVSHIAKNRGNMQGNAINFCFAGTINTRKGINVLLEAFNSSYFEHDKLHLCGRLFPEQDKLIKKLALKNVVLPGFVSTESYFAGCDVYVFPSLMEGSSKSIYEAMAAGMPVITTYNSGSVVRDGVDGFIIPVGDAKAIRDRMLYFKNNPAKILEMGQNALERAKEFPWSKYGNRVIEKYIALGGIK